MSKLNELYTQLGDLFSKWKPIIDIVEFSFPKLLGFKFDG